MKACESRFNVPIATLDEDLDDPPIEKYFRPFSQANAKKNFANCRRLTNTSNLNSIDCQRLSISRPTICGQTSTSRSLGPESFSNSPILCDDEPIDVEEDDEEVALSFGLVPQETLKNLHNLKLASSEELVGSLENLVACFDAKITSCLKNMNENIDALAPVQISNRQENRAEMDMPTEFSRKIVKTNLPPLFFETIQTDLERKDKDGTYVGYDNTPHLCDSGKGASLPVSPRQTAEQAIEEIDRIMQLSYISEYTATSDHTMDSADSLYSPDKASQFTPGRLEDPFLNPHVKNFTSFADCSIDANLESELKLLSKKKLISYRIELESLIKIYNEILVQELANRDELEYEKELKNTFISLMTSIQSKKRKYHGEHRRKKKNVDGSTIRNGPTINAVPQYLTTVVPYEVGSLLSVQTLEALIKILRAINDDNSNVPTMLTDYILNVLCPSPNN